MGFKRIRKEVVGVNYWNGNFDELFVNGVYDDGRNNDLDYGIGRKRYWNKKSGKWVESNKYNVFKSDIVYWYEFENLNEKLIVDWFKNDGVDGNYNGFKFIDGVGIFISYLYKKILIDKGLKEDEEVDEYDKGIYIDRKKVERFFGSCWKEGINKLLEKKIISERIFKENKYDNRKYLKYYLLNISQLGKIVDKKFVEVKRIEEEIIDKEEEYNDVNWVELEHIKKLELNISDERLDEICELKYNNKIKGYLKELKWGSIFNSKKDFERKNKFISRDKDFYNNVVRRRYKVYKDIIDDIGKGIIDYSLFGYDKFSGRYYNIINSMDKEFRGELRVDGEELVELDLKNCYVSCLMYYLERLNVFRSIEKSGEDFRLMFKKDMLFNRELEFNVESEKDINSKWNEYIKKYKKVNWFESESVRIGSSGILKVDGCKFGDDLENVILNELNDENYNEFFNEFYKVVNYLNIWYKDDKVKKGYVKLNKTGGENYISGKNINNFNYEVNRDWVSFFKSDNLIFDSYRYLKERWLRSEFENDKIEVETNIIYGNTMEQFGKGGKVGEGRWVNGSFDVVKKNSEWLRKKYGSWRDYIEDNINNVEGLFKNRVDHFEYKIEKGEYNIRLRELSKKYELKWEIEWESVRYKFNNDKEEYYKKYGKKIKLNLKEDVILDMSKNEELDGEEFRNRYKELCFSKLGKNVDFYSYLKLQFSDFGRFKKGIKYNIEDFVVGKNVIDLSDGKIYDRSFYKELIMRLMFSKKFLVDNIGVMERGNIMDLIFGKNLNEIIYWLKGFDFNVDFNGKRIERKNMNDRYKSISKLLGVIEVDVVEYLEKNYLFDKYYVKIFDGFLVKKSDKNLFKVNMNMILKNNVGYMFELR